MRKYGFLELNYEGKKAKATGMRLKSVLADPTNNPDEHLEKVGAVIRDFKARTNSNCFLRTTKCVAQSICDLATMRKLERFSETT